VIACIIKKTDASFDEKEINLFMKENLSRFKVPKEYHLMSDFPRSPAGKILKRKLREQIIA
jgi:acyl-CoA synthetase (AMP-forming)/AMP-acid ligase II